MSKNKYNEWLTPEGLLKLQSWARDGLTDEQIAHNIGISRSTLNEWKKKYSDISDTLKKSKMIVDIEVENALLKKALGFKETYRRPFKLKQVVYNDGKKVKEEEYIEYAEEEIFVPPETTAQIFWLKNRKPDSWRDKVEYENPEELSKLDEMIELIKEEAAKKDGA